MAGMESLTTWLRRLWSNTWDAARFAAERPLRTPAFTLSACSAQLDLAAQAIVRIRAAIDQDMEVMDILPVEGRSCSFLERTVDGAENASSPVKDPAGFVRALVHAALQTGDGTYGFGLEGEAAADVLIDQHCADLLSAAKALQDPSIALQELQSSMTELTGAMQLLHSQESIKASEKAVELSSQVKQLSRDIQHLVGRIREIAKPVTEMSEALEADQSSAEDSAPAFEQGEAVTDTAEPDANEAFQLERTKSQVVKRIKVDEVAQALETHREPLQQLRKALSQLDGQARSNGEDKHSRYERTANDLKQAQKLQQRFRDFGEDLMESMLNLDQISGLAEEDRQARKDTLKGLQNLLDEIDAAKPRVAKMQTRLAEELKQLERTASKEPHADSEVAEQEEPPAPVDSDAPEEPPRRMRRREHHRSETLAPLASPRVDWTRLRLPLKFSLDERPRAYLFSASVAGLDPDSIRLSRREDGILRVQGARYPSSAQQRAMLRLLAEHIEHMPRQQRQRLSQEDADEMLLQLGHGRFGRFVQDLELPHDVDWEAIEPSYDDGVLRILLPRRAAPMPMRHAGWLDGMPSNFFW